MANPQLEVKVVGSGAQAEVQVLAVDDQIGLSWGTDKDFVIVLNSAGLSADAELTDVIEGTSDHQGVAANSAIFSNITTDGDIMMLVSDAGNSKEFLLANGDTADLQLGHGMATVTVKTASGNLTLNPTADLILNDGQNFIGDTVNTNMTVGLTINQGTADNQTLCLKSSTDVAHGLTDDVIGGVNVETDDFFVITKTVETGGVQLMGMMEDTAGEPTVMRIDAYGGTASTAKTTAARGLIELYAAEVSSAALANITANGTVFSIRARVGNANVSRFAVDEDGDIFSVTVIDIAASTGTDVLVAAAFDEYEDDVALLDVYDNLRAPETAIRQDWAEWVEYNEQTLIDAGILGGTIEEGGMTNVTQLQRAHNGALRQTVEDLMSIAMALPQEARKALTPRVQARLRALEAA
jgi:hypothetical protein